MSIQNPLQKLAIGGVLAGLVAVPGLASASHQRPAPGPTLVTIDNEFDGKGEVFVDGRYVGTVAGDTTGAFPVAPGCRTIAVKRPGTGFLMARVELTLARGSNTVLPVQPPRGTLRVTNSGEVALHLRADGATSVWVSPGGTALMNVETGNVDLKASIRDPRGEWVAIERDVWVEPGRSESTVLKPDPTVLVVSNHERYPVRALVDGIDIGWIEPGTTQETWIRPGRADVVLLDRSGRVRTTTSVVLRKGEDTRVVLQPPAPARPGIVVTAQMPTVVVSASLHGHGHAHHVRPGPRFRYEWDPVRDRWVRR